LSKIIALIKDKIGKDILINGSLYTFINPHSYNILRKDDCLNRIDTFFIDSIYLVKILKLFKIANTKRRSFDMTSCAPIVFQKASENNYKIFIVGSIPGVIDAAIENIKLLFPMLNIIGFRNGYFKNDEEREMLLNKLTYLNPDIIIAGLGAVRQERFLIDLRTKGWIGTGFTCGGFLHQTAKKPIYYPKWIDRYHLRWVYRTFDEPKLITRYFFEYPISFLKMLYDIYINRYHKV
jgi:exopolysaccharide biosynthesis WecB/TagA/CpsF family protein